MKKYVKILCMALTIVTMICCLTACKENVKINMNEYAKIEYSGIDGEAEAAPVIQVDKFLYDYSELFDWHNLSEKEQNELKNDITNALSGSISQTTGLKNGMLLKWTWNNDAKDIKEFKKKYNVELTYSDFDFSVSSLVPIRNMDATKGIEIDFSGIAPNGKATLNMDNAAFVDFGFQYSMSKEEGLSNGDVITITAIVNLPEGYESEEDFFGEYGYILKTTTREVVVTGLLEYADDVEKLDKDEVEKLIQKPINEKTQKYDEVDTLELIEMKNVGHIILNAKENGEIHNVLYFVYQITMKDITDNKTITYFVYGKYQNVAHSADGKIHQLKDLTYEMPVASSLLGDITGEGFIVDNILIQGFKTYKDLYDACVDESKFTVVENVDLSE